MRGLILALIIVGLLVAGLIVGIFAQQAAGLLSWFCLSPFAFFLLGRASRAFRSPVRWLSSRDLQIIDDSRRRAGVR